MLSYSRCAEVSFEAHVAIIKQNHTMPTLTKKPNSAFRVLERIGNRAVVSIDIVALDDVLEELEMTANRATLQARYTQSAASGKSSLTW